MLNSNRVISESGIAFGTSGARGLVGDFTQNVCAAFAHAFLDVISKKYRFTTVAIAIDNRPSSYKIAQACALAAKQHGFWVEFHGVIPTPALAFYSMQHSIPCIMVTGSHIPFDRNGLKFYRPDGEITKEDEKAILQSSFAFSPLSQLPKLEVTFAGSDAYIKRYTSLFSASLLAGKRIGIYEHSSAGRDIYASLFRELGAEVVSLGRSDHFVPIDTEAVSEEDRLMARRWSNEYQLDAIFSTDGDGDRPLVADETGNWLRGDILGLLAATALKIEAVAIPVSCNTAIDLSKKFKSVEHTKIGSPYVIAAFDTLNKSYSSVAGFEANGGFLLASNINVNGVKLAALPTRDAILPALMLLVLATQEKISTLVGKLPRRFTWSDRLKDFPSSQSQEIITNAMTSPQTFLSQLGLASSSCVNVDNTDGARFTLTDGNIIHLRPSGNAPELRCYTEAESEEQAKMLVKLVLQKLTSL
ncbi:phosphomannomutase [Kosakonia pseudosacchari]|uniref:phosphomannomutase n=1 Tax=Kosakonia pseudosacchari TaxID=1646340 RepID=UPI000A3B79B9|nr:phosphomannomutase [Kosakonia pseudosacchari]